MNAPHKPVPDRHAPLSELSAAPEGDADLAVVSAFLNALLREWDGWFLTEGEEIGLGGKEYLALPLDRSEGLYIEIVARTAFRFRFGLPFHLRSGNGVLSTLNVVDALTRLILDPEASPGDADLRGLLLWRVLDSHRASRQACREKTDIPADPGMWNFQQAEQALIHGHPTHPNPRSRDEMSVEEARRYAPELGGRYPLFWSLAHKDMLALMTGTDRSPEAMCREMQESDDRLAPLTEALADRGGDFMALPWHPWQAARLLARPEVISGIRDGAFIPFGEMGRSYAATASFRGAQAFHSPYMLKFSLSLRLTNSTRVLARKEVERGVQLAALLAGPFGGVLREEFPAVSILKEPGFAALRGQGGSVLEESFVVFRDNPFRDPAGQGPIALASLCEFRGSGQCPLVTLIHGLAERMAVPARAAARTWLAEFVRIAILPVLEIRARHGLLFGAHQQNMMIQLADGLPAGLWLRDCQGTGHLSTHHDHLAAYLPDIGANAENVVPPEMGDGLLSYYVIVNNLLNVISTLVLHDLIEERVAYALVRDAFAEAAAETTGDRTFYDKMLTGPTLVSKGNYRTSLSNVNEASGDASGQLAAFFELPNPFSK